MFCVACCDDNAPWLEQFAQQLSRLLRARGTPYRIYTYPNGEALMADLADPNNAMHLLFLDIMLAEEDGLALAARLRAVRPRLPVVLMSSSAEFALSGYAVHPAHYLLKPISDEALGGALDYCMSLRSTPEPLVFRWQKAEKVLPVGEILYVEVFDALLKVHTRTGTVYQTTGHLSQLELKLPPGQFFRCHKSYLVNLDYVEGIRRYSLLLTGGHTVPVSKQNYTAVKQAYLSYSSRRLG